MIALFQAQVSASTIKSKYYIARRDFNPALDRYKNWDQMRWSNFPGCHINFFSSNTQGHNNSALGGT